MKHTSHQLSAEQKENLFQTHYDLLFMIHSFGGYMLRKQMKTIYHLLFPQTSEMQTDFLIAELINSGFLLQKRINKGSKTEILYLNKYVLSRFLDIAKSGNAPLINWSNHKVYLQIFKMDYLIEYVIPQMRKEGYEINVENTITYLSYTGNNLLLSHNQTDIFNLYNFVGHALQNSGYKFTEEFFRDMEIAKYQLQCFKALQLHQNQEVEPCQAKIQRDAERTSYNNEIERNKYFYHLKNFASKGFIFESVKENTIKLAFFDCMDSIQTKKLYTNLVYILLMFQRYTSNNDINIKTTVYLWDKDRCQQMISEEGKKTFDFYRQEMRDEPKKEAIFQDLGLLPSNWDKINVEYKSFDTYMKYNVTCK